jgi:rhodanese-related sulfurtransferase
MTTTAPALPTTTSEAVREALRAGSEIALLDVREEDPFAREHPLFAAQLALARLELDAPWRLPRRDVPIVVYDDGEALAPAAAHRLQALGYQRVSLLAGGLDGWRRSGGELFQDVNVPSKAFGELVEHELHTPSLSAEEVQALLQGGADMVVLDARRFEEYQTMSIPAGISVPGAELALRVRDLAPDPATRVIVNCAGRTRSIIGAQSLRNAGIPNPVCALRNGTIGWTLAGFALEHGQSRRFGQASAAARDAARQAAGALADRAGAQRLRAQDLDAAPPDGRTVYRYDVRTPQEYGAGHLPGFGNAQGGQLVQETDVYAPVRGARLVLVDGGDDARAPMTAHWLAQMGWDVAWVEGVPADRFSDRAAWPPVPPAPDAAAIAPEQLAAALDAGTVWLLDLGASASHVQRHIPGARWALRSQLAQAMDALAREPLPPQRIVLTSEDGAVAAFAAADLAGRRATPVAVLAGGNRAWFAQGRPHATGDAHLASPRIDRYRRPYEGTGNARQAMQAYLDWEYGLVAQLARDGTHRFRVLRPESA